MRSAKILLNWAAKASRRYIDFNPWEEIGYLTERARKRIITDEEFTHLLANCADGNISGGARDFREQLLVLRHTGMRPGELRLLKWGYVQWDRHKIVFPPTVIKTRSRRAVTMTEKVEQVLGERKKRCGEGYVFPGVGTNIDGKRAAVASDRHIHAGPFSQRFRRLFNRCVELGLIEKEKSGEKLVLYSSRHTRITELVTNGLGMKVVMEEAGHKVPNTTNRYMHLADKDVTNQVRLLAGKPPDGSGGGG